MAQSELTSVLLTLGKTQVDALFRRQDVDAIDDSEFLPMLEVVLTAFETAEVEQSVSEEIWQYAIAAYDRNCREVDPSWTTEVNWKRMQKYLLGPRGRKRKPRRSSG